VGQRTARVATPIHDNKNLKNQQSEDQNRIMNTDTQLPPPRPDPDQEAAIYAQAYALAQMHRTIWMAEKEAEKYHNELNFVRQQLDMERDQHAKTRTEAQKLMEENALLTSKLRTFDARIIAMESQILMGGDEARLKTAQARIEELEKQLRELTE